MYDTMYDTMSTMYDILRCTPNTLFWDPNNNAVDLFEQSLIWNSRVISAELHYIVALKARFIASTKRGAITCIYHVLWSEVNNYHIININIKQ